MRPGGHHLLNTLASLMLAARVEPKKVQAVLGHSSIMVTLDVSGRMPDRRAWQSSPPPQRPGYDAGLQFCWKPRMG